MQMKELIFVVAFLPNIVGCAEPSNKQVVCPNLSGNYYSVGKMDWVENGNRETNILREAFKYSLPERVGDPRKYEALLRIKYDWFSLDIRNDVFFFGLHDNQKIVYEFSFGGVCGPSGWQTKRISKRYLDGNSVLSHFESIFSINDSENLVIQTYFLGENSKSEVRAEFVQRR